LIHNLLPTLRTMLQLHLLSFLAIARSRSAALRRMVLLNCAMAALGAHTHTLRHVGSGLTSYSIMLSLWLRFPGGD
jgi:uncharacterized membrane protein YadS